MYGKSRWGIDNCLGYSHLHVPVFSQSEKEERVLRVAILRPRCSNILASLTSWITGRNPELKDPQTLLNSNKVKGNVIYDFINYL